MELLLFGLLCLLSLWVLGWLVGRSRSNGQVWTGIDSLHPSDPDQYLGFIRAAAHSLLISNLFDIKPSATSFLHPGFLISGLVTDLGVPSWLALLLWKPVAVVAIFIAVRAYAHRLIPTRTGRRVALLLALFFVSTAAYLGTVLAAGTQTNLYLLALEVELWPGTYLWGYPFTGIAVAAIPAALLLYERDRRRGRIGLAAPALALICSWLQPWQGATLLLILFASELLSPRSEPHGRGADGEGAVVQARASARRRMPRLILTMAAGGAPLAYYALLAHFDPAWTLNGKANRFGAWPVWAIVLAIAPLGVPAALAYLKRPVSFQDIALRIWPLAGLAIYWVIALTKIGTFPIHAFQGLSIPLAVLAVTGVQGRLRIQSPTAMLLTAGVVAAAIVPALVWKLNDARRSTASDNVFFLGGPPLTYYLTHGEADALHYLDADSAAGGVLTSAALGEAVPGRTGRQTWVGIPSFTPDYGARAGEVERFLSGGMPAKDAVVFVRSTGARFLLVDCRHHTDVGRLIRTIVLDQRAFGCATVFRLT